MSRFMSVALVLLAVACSRSQPPAPPSYLFVWAGDAERKGSDFLGVIDANPSPRATAASSRRFRSARAARPRTTPSRSSGSTNICSPTASGRGGPGCSIYAAGLPEDLDDICRQGGLQPSTFVRPVEQRRGTRHLSIRGRRGGARRPRSRGNQGERGGQAKASDARGKGVPQAGSCWMNERGDVVRSASARDPNIAYRYLYPYHVLPLPAIDRALSTHDRHGRQEHARDVRMGAALASVGPDPAQELCARLPVRAAMSTSSRESCGRCRTARACTSTRSVAACIWFAISTRPNRE